ncbi:MAG: hypothetical protein KDA28_09480 [Phycisphaerales bacterium]|nr:hypothetical protein [Phycisphaerales bacterium]
MIDARKIEERRWFMIRMIRIGVAAACVMFVVASGGRLTEALTRGAFGGGPPHVMHLVVAIVASSHWLGLALLGVLFEKRLARWLVPIPRDACVRCGYPMHGDRPEKCPECGMPMGS